jgi:hypothetical protein
LPANIRQGGREWMANTLAYYDTAKITAVNFFIVLAQGHNVPNFYEIIFWLCP